MVHYSAKGLKGIFLIISCICCLTISLSLNQWKCQVNGVGQSVETECCPYLKAQNSNLFVIPSRLNLKAVKCTCTTFYYLPLHNDDSYLINRRIQFSLFYYVHECFFFIALELFVFFSFSYLTFVFKEKIATIKNVKFPNESNKSIACILEDIRHNPNTMKLLNSNMNNDVLVHTLPVQCSCLASKPHTRNENVLLWSTKGICKEQERRKNKGQVCVLPSSKQCGETKGETLIKQKSRNIPTYRLQLDRVWHLKGRMYLPLVLETGLIPSTHYKLNLNHLPFSRQKKFGRAAS